MPRPGVRPAAPGTTTAPAPGEGTGAVAGAEETTDPTLPGVPSRPRPEARREPVSGEEDGVLFRWGQEGPPQWALASVPR